MLQRIAELKKEKNAVILAHNYTCPELQDLADHTGDSLELSRIASKTDADVIVFCGVHFMAETAKILSPEKTVLIPDKNAGCPMADTITIEKLRLFKAMYPGVPVVAYVNTTAAIKSEVNVCCTSANAVNVVRNIDSDTVLFVPDRHLGAYIGRQIPEKKIICWDGCCPVHNRILATDVINKKKMYPGALVVAHPECPADVLELADIIASTSGMIREIKNSDKNEFIICTERGLIHQFAKNSPEKSFINVNPVNVCPNMKKMTPEKLLHCLETMTDEVVREDSVIKNAAKALERMILY
ncbi:MAG: quinolinate synthase NadA [Abditibacteriota bacterium]|nr:quinolinate synthase NadA [Abditibacteriota bacterium]